jgi:hypothetical protein
MLPSDIASSLDVFVSYSSQDQERVFPIVGRLESAGIGLWLDRHRIDGGMRWADEIVRGIKNARVFMLMCSDAAMRSRAVKQEIQLAWKYELAYLPLLLERTHFPEQLEFFLEGCQWIDVLDLPENQWLPPLLRALVHVGVQCSGMEALANEPGAVVRPTRPGPGIEGLRSVAKFTERIWPLVVEERTHRGEGILYTVRDLGAAREGAQHQIRLGSRVFWAIDWDREAHLLLLDEGPEGKLYCLCPSWFVPDTRLRPGLNLLPPESAGCEPFVLTGVPGRENLLAIITEKPLELGWMPPSTQVAARVLDGADIDRLLSLLQSLDPGSWVALATFCDVTV